MMMCHKLPGKSVMSGKQRHLMTEICEMKIIILTMTRQIYYLKSCRLLMF